MSGADAANETCHGAEGAEVARAELRRELDHWAGEGRQVDVWWRDDDAVEPTPALDRLLAAARSRRAPIAVAVIPASMDGSLVLALDDPLVTVLQHGWRHANHAAEGERAVECGGERSAAAVVAELREGWDRLAAGFGDRVPPILVPPWNRIAPEVVAALPAAGYAGLSVFGPRAHREAAPGLAEINTHLDLLTWKGGARFAGREKLFRLAAERLADRRSERSDPDEPFGILTHHLVHDAATWSFLDELLDLFSAHPAVRWLAVNSLKLAPAGGGPGLS